MTGIWNRADGERLRRANPVREAPDRISEHPSARALLSHITAMDRETVADVADVAAPAVTTGTRRRAAKALAIALTGAVVAAGTAYGVARWSVDDLPPAGSGEDSFVLPETRILPGGYESTRPPLYRDLPRRPSIRFPAGTAYDDAATAYLSARRDGHVLPAGAILADPLPDGVVVQATSDGLRLDPAAPFGYDLDTGIVLTPGRGATRTPLVPAAILPRCQILLGAEAPARRPACPTGPAVVERHREVDGRWEPFDRVRVVPIDASGPTTLALLGRPIAPSDRLPDSLRTAVEAGEATLPPLARTFGSVTLSDARLAGGSLGERVWAIPGEGDEFCMLVAGRAGYSATCGSVRRLAAFGALTLIRPNRRAGSGSKLWALVADGYSTARIDGGEPRPIRDNLVGFRSGREFGHVVTLSGVAGTRTVPVP